MAKNWASVDLGCKLIDFSSDVEGCPPVNVLDNNLEQLWLTKEKLPQWVCLSLTELHNTSSIIVRTVGWHCWHAYVTNPRVVKLHVSTDGENFKLWDTLVATEQTVGAQLFCIAPLSTTIYPFIVFEVMETFRSSYSSRGGGDGSDDSRSPIVEANDQCTCYINCLYLYTDEVPPSPSVNIMNMVYANASVATPNHTDASILGGYNSDGRTSPTVTVTLSAAAAASATGLNDRDGDCADLTRDLCTAGPESRPESSRASLAGSQDGVGVTMSLDSDVDPPPAYGGGPGTFAAAQLEGVGEFVGAADRRADLFSALGLTPEDVLGDSSDSSDSDGGVDSDDEGLAGEEAAAGEGTGPRMQLQSQSERGDLSSTPLMASLEADSMAATAAAVAAIVPGPEPAADSEADSALAHTGFPVSVPSAVSDEYLSGAFSVDSETDSDLNIGVPSPDQTALPAPSATVGTTIGPKSSSGSSLGESDQESDLQPPTPSAQPDFRPVSARRGGSAFPVEADADVVDASTASADVDARLARALTASAQLRQKQMGGNSSWNGGADEAVKTGVSTVRDAPQEDAAPCCSSSSSSSGRRVGYAFEDDCSSDSSGLGDSEDEYEDGKSSIFSLTAVSSAGSGGGSASKRSPGGPSRSGRSESTITLSVGTCESVLMPSALSADVERRRRMDAAELAPTPPVPPLPAHGADRQYYLDGHRYGYGHGPVRSDSQSQKHVPWTSTSRTQTWELEAASREASRDRARGLEAASREASRDRARGLEAASREASRDRARGKERSRERSISGDVLMHSHSSRSAERHSSGRRPNSLCERTSLRESSSQHEHSHKHSRHQSQEPPRQNQHQRHGTSPEVVRVVHLQKPAPEREGTHRHSDRAHDRDRDRDRGSSSRVRDQVAARLSGESKARHSARESKGGHSERGEKVERVPAMRSIRHIESMVETVLRRLVDGDGVKSTTAPVYARSPDTTTVAVAKAPVQHSAPAPVPEPEPEPEESVDEVVAQLYAAVLRKKVKEAQLAMLLAQEPGAAKAPAGQTGRLQS